MRDLVSLSVEDMAALKAIDGPHGANAEPTEATAKLVAFGLIRATPLGFYLARAGKLHLAAIGSVLVTSDAASISV